MLYMLPSQFIFEISSIGAYMVLLHLGGFKFSLGFRYATGKCHLKACDCVNLATVSLT